MKISSGIIKQFQNRFFFSTSMFSNKPQRIEPKEGQESVWDYPRPPRIEDVSKRLRVIFNGETIADTKRARRVLETSHPPAYYIPLDDVKKEFLVSNTKHTFCEWKGQASYYDLKVGEKRVNGVAWYYPTPIEAFVPIANYVCFYANKVDECYVDDEKVQAQEGDFYGGWITKDIVGPFKGATGTTGW